jgi:hypothetical protein
MRQTVKKWMENFKNYNDSDIEKELNRLGVDLVLRIGQALMGKESTGEKPITPLSQETNETNETVNGQRTSYARGARQLSSNYVEESDSDEESEILVPRKRFVNPPPSYNAAVAETTVVPTITVECEVQPNPTPSAVAVDKYQEIKELLKEYGESALNKRQNAVPVTIDMKSVEGLTLHIKTSLASIDFKHFQSLQLRMNIAVSLVMLMSYLQKPDVNGVVMSKATAYEYMRKEFKIAESTYKHYQAVYKFLQYYPRFQHSSLTFTMLRKYHSLINEWFNTATCRLLAETDYKSKLYWELNFESNPLLDNLTEGMHEVVLSDDNSDLEDAQSEED